MISILVNLVFITGLLAIIAAIKRNRGINSKHTQNLIQISSVVFILSYIIRKEVLIQVFLRTLLTLYLPIIISQLGFILSLYDDLISYILISIELTIFHTEIETTIRPIVLVLCLLFISFQFNKYINNFHINKVMYINENNSYALWGFVVIFWIIFLVNRIVLIFNIDDDLFLVLIPGFGLVFPLITFLLASCLLEFCIRKIIIFKFFLSLNMILHSILAYVGNSYTFTKISILLSISFIIISFLIHLNNKKLMVFLICVDGDVYKIIDKNYLRLLEKGNKNEIIEREIYYEGVTYEVSQFKNHCLKRYDLENLTIKNPKILDFLYQYDHEIKHLENIKIDCELLNIADHVVLDMKHHCTNLSLSDKCKSFAQVGGKTFSRKMDLVYVKYDSVHLLINRSCRIIEKLACYHRTSLKSVKFPDSLIEIEAYAFRGCVNLRKITFDQNSQLRYIGCRAFCHTDLRFISFPKLLFKIDKSAFESCDKLKKVFFPDRSQMKTLYLDLFAINNISIDIPKSILISSHSDIINIDYRFEIHIHANDRLLILVRYNVYQIGNY